MKYPIEEINWGKLWNDGVNSMPNMETSSPWNILANNFKNWQEKDDYADKLLDIIKTNETDTVLDIGCGVGTISVPLSSKVSHVTGIDLSPVMLEILEERLKSEKITNFTFYNTDLKEFRYDNFDIVIASRSLNYVSDIEKVIEKINSISKKAYITLWGPKSENYLNNILELIGRKRSIYPNFIYIYNILLNMGLTPNITDLKCESRNVYGSIEQAVHRHLRKIGKVSDKEKEVLRNYLEDTLVYNDDGTYTTSFEDDDWILIYWEN